ncbi:MAG TPA: AMP-binding protein, partial [Candidatus Sulfotelmatobacter sp.]|nr:AMP-binding protein [Candidatus Sulfotelmatobacter sp.]
MREPAPSETGLGVRPMLERQARRLGERPFMVLPDGRLTYRDADELGNRTAAVLQEAGCRRGDIVMARCGNNMAMVAAWFGCMKLGAVFMPVNTLLTGEALRTVVAHAGAALLICDGDLYPEVAAIQDALPMLRTVLLSRSCDSKHVTGGVRQSGTVATFCLEDLIDRAPSHPPPPLHDEPGAAAKLMYTSGTTGT